MEDAHIIARREVVVMHPFTNEPTRYSGDKVHSVTDKGVVLEVSISKMFYPWHRVTQFTYHSLDKAVRSIIQGY